MVRCRLACCHVTLCHTLKKLVYEGRQVRASLCIVGLLLILVNLGITLLKREDSTLISYMNANFMSKISNRCMATVSRDDYISISRNDYIGETEALQYKSCSNTMEANIRALSEHRANKSNYNFGETVQFTLTLIDGNGKPRRGGDKIFVSLQNTKLGAYAPGVVTDLRNGSYVARIDVLWRGDVRVVIWLFALREVITSMYRVMLELKSTRHTVAIFKGENSVEETLCDVDSENLVSKTNKYMSYGRVCNFTYLNSGEPWYCGHPDKLMCDDWMLVTAREYPLPDYPINSCEAELLKSVDGRILTEFHITGLSKYSHISAMSAPKVPCSCVEKEPLWKMRQPTGYFYNHTWNLRHCRGLSEDGISRCLKNKTIYLFGDSTVRHWFTDIAKRFKCVLVSEKSSSHAHKPMYCVNTNINYSVLFCSHNQPFNVGSTHNESNMYTLYSVSRRLDEISVHENPIILIHMYAHLVQYHESVFRMKVRFIRLGIEHLLNRNPKSKILIKMPHFYMKPRAYFGYTYIDIWRDELKYLHNRVIFLDNNDITIATRNVDIHPPGNVVSAMVDQMFSYACDVTEN